MTLQERTYQTPLDFGREPQYGDMRSGERDLRRANTTGVSVDHITIVSSDGHATALMADYRPYLEHAFHDDFDRFLVEWNDHGSRNFDPPALMRRMDPDLVADWRTKMLDSGRLDGNWDPVRRLREMESEGVAAEVVFPDFGIPFELYSLSFASAMGWTPPPQGHVDAACRAYNRWLADFIASAPERFAGMALVPWHDVEAAVNELRRVKESGLKGIVLPHFEPDEPLYLDKFEPIWNTLEELELVVNAHAGSSSTSTRPIFTGGIPHPGCGTRIYFPEGFFFFRNLLSHAIWGGVMERHPGLTFVFTEGGSAWIVSDLLEADHAYLTSYHRKDVHQVIRSKPSEYFARQCFLGSSVFTRAEIEARHVIGVDKMMLGMDYPHHEGTLVRSTQDYLRATLGACNVPVDEARTMLGATATRIFDFDADHLAKIAAGIDSDPATLLRAPEEALFPLGDVVKPNVLVRA